MSSRITSIAALIQHFGGPLATARALRSTPQKVCNWRRVGRLPPELYMAHRRRLARHQVDVPDDLWGWAEAGE